VAAEDASGDDRSTVSLRALLGLRGQVGRARVTPVVSRLGSGQQSSRLYGRGMDYAESRAYQAGDDVRRMDWRLTARSGKLHTKLFQEDREGSVLIVLDTHASMRFGTRGRFKSVQAARVAAAIAWRAAGAGERVGLAAYGALDSVFLPRPGARAALAVCGALARWDARSVAPRSELLSAALGRLRPLSRRASRVVLISDGFSCDSAAQARLRDIALHASACVLLVADALELELPPAGSYPLEHAGRQVLTVLHTERQRRDFQRALGAGASRLRELAGALPCRLLQLDSGGDAVAASAEVFARRGVRT
jgi:uncharacterized protein (DUF58 family)